MLLYFKFKNFKSFHQEAILDLRATKISDHEEGISEAYGKRVLNIAGIFGANASGKSNALDALRYMCQCIKNSFKYDASSKDSNFGLNAKEPSCFEVEYLSEMEKGKVYKYGFEIDENGIKREWLFYSSKTARGKYKKIFTRDELVLDLVGLPPREIKIIKPALDKYSLLLSLGAKLNIKKLQTVATWFANCMFVDFGNPFKEFMTYQHMPDNIQSTKVQEKISKYLANFDHSIIGLDIEPVNEELVHATNSVPIRIYVRHKIENSTKGYSLPLEKEAAGILKMFILYSAFCEAFTKDSILIVDDLNGRLHPLLVEAIIRAFHHKQINKSNGQLIFTSHDVSSLKRELLRRDEINFVEKDLSGESQLYSLAGYRNDDRKIRKEENFEKNYLEGKYGAVPELTDLKGLF